jgi:hypothetical protein
MPDHESDEPGLQSYLRIVRGLGLMAKDRAASGAHIFLARAGLDDAATDAGERLTKLVDEVSLAGRANREMLDRFIAIEVERASERLGFVRATELTDLRTDLAALRIELNVLRAELAAIRESRRHE